MPDKVYVTLNDIPIQVRRQAATIAAKHEPNPFKALAIRLAAENPEGKAGLWVDVDEAFQVCVLGRAAA